MGYGDWSDWVGSTSWNMELNWSVDLNTRIVSHWFVARCGPSEGGAGWTWCWFGFGEAQLNSALGAASEL